MHRRSLTRVAAALAALTLTSQIVAAPAIGVEGPQAPTDGEPGALVLVLDSSGSMGEPAGGGGTRIEAAKRALADVVDALPDDQRVALRVFGSEVEFADQPGACEDSERVVDLGTDNREALRSAIRDYQPFGETPTGYALREAGKDLGDSGPRSIILVSDGEPTCDPDPCEVARELAADGVDVRIDVVGLSVSGKARETLECVAEEGGGTYYDADDADDIVDSLTTSAARAARPFDFAGTPVEGTPAETGAPRLGPGQWLDAMPDDGALYYVLPRTEPGSRLHVGIATRSRSDATTASVRMSITTPGEDDSCFTDASIGVVLGLRNPVLNVGGPSTPGASADDACATSETLLLKVQHGTGATEPLAGQPLEIVVYEEPPLRDPASPPAAVAPLPRGAWEPMEPSDESTAVVPGTSLANAPVIGDGTWSADIQPGEAQVFAVPADWGQDVQAQLDTRITRDAADAASVASRLDVTTLGPARERNGVDFYANEPDDWTSTAFGNIPAGTDFRTGARTQPVSWSGDTRTPGSVAGLRYVQVAYNVRGDAANLPYTLTVRTNGAPGEGTPAYATETDLPVPDAESALTDLTLPEKPSGDVPDADDSAGLPWAALAGGVVAVLLVAAAAVLVLRRRSRSST